jgi:serine protease inhibitor
MRILKYHAGVVCAAIAAAVIGLTSCRPAGSPNTHSANSSSTQPTPSTPPPVLARHPQLQEGSAKFAVRLLQQVLEERPNDNFCVSPLDVQSGLSLLLSGLHAQGYQEVADALGYGELPLDAVNAFQRTVWEQVHAEGDAYEVRQALALYTVTPYRWTAAVKQQAQDWYPTAFYELEEASLQQQIGQLQSWLQEQTKTRVALSPELWQQIAAYPTLAGVVSALFLKADWEQPLGIAPPIEFRTADGRKRSVDAMARRFERLPYLEERDFEAVALPYRGGQLRFYLFLPREGVSLRQWVQQLDTARWRAWRKQFKEREVELHMPKFEVASEHDLRDTLQQIGVRADFSGRRLARRRGGRRDGRLHRAVGAAGNRSRGRARHGSRRRDCNHSLRAGLRHCSDTGRPSLPVRYRPRADGVNPVYGRGARAACDGAEIKRGAGCSLPAAMPLIWVQPPSTKSLKQCALFPHPLFPPLPQAGEGETCGWANRRSPLHPAATGGRGGTRGSPLPPGGRGAGG